MTKYRKNFKKYPPKKKSSDVIKEAILKKLEEDTLPWMKPWTGSNVPLGSNKNFKTGKTYRGVNAILTFNNQFSSPNWLTFKQINELGYHLKKGSTGTPVVFWGSKKVVKESDSENEEDKVYNLRFMKHYMVYNLDQIEGVECPDREEIKLNKFEGIEAAESIIANYENAPRIVFESQRAFYNKIGDFINMPVKESFNCAESYYSTLFHEAAHSTGHKSRLNRKSLMDATYFADHEYSKEELVAEIASSILCREIGIHAKVEDNQAAYVKGWLSKLKQDPNILIDACCKAQSAVDHIKGVKFESRQ